MTFFLYASGKDVNSVKFNLVHFMLDCIRIL